MKPPNKTAVVFIALIISILLNIFLYQLNEYTSSLLSISIFLSENPKFEDVKNKFGEPGEIYQNSSQIKQTGWGIPPWKSERRIYVFSVHYEKVYIVFDEEGFVCKFWVGTS